MNTFDLLKVHHYETVHGQPGTVRLTKEAPYLRLVAEGDPPIYVKDGQFYSESGEVRESLPDWFWREARKITPAARASVRLTLPDEPPAPQPKAETVTMWACPTCKGTFELAKKGAHVMQHRRQAKRAVEVAGAV